MGRKPKISDDAFLEIMNACDVISTMQNNIEEYWNKIYSLKEQAKTAQASIRTMKKELATKYGVSVSYIDQLNNITTKRSRILKIKGIDAC